MRPTLRMILLALVTFTLAPLPALVWGICLGARGPTLRAGARALHLWGKLVCRVLGVRIRQQGRPPAGACLIASNHLGYVDILVLASCYPGLFLSMAEVGRWPMVGTLARLAGTLFIDRARLSDVALAHAAMARDLAGGLKVTFFPEGHASRGCAVGPFHSALLEAARAARVSCVPVTLSYDTEPPLEPALCVCWWGDMTFLPHFRRLLELPSFQASVVFGEPLPASEDRKALARSLHERVQQAFVPVRQPKSDHKAWPSAET